MKKLLIALCFMIGFTGFVSAQIKKKPDPKVAKIERIKPSAATTTAVVKDEAGPKKADGTLDKRYKVNKKAPGKLKKDGTPDLRYSENKKKKD